jgi:ketosteroid isomerase-like protein
MITSTAVLTVLLLLAPQGGGSNDAAAAASIEQLEQAWNHAHLAGDIDVLDSLWSSEISVIVPGMQPLSKGQLLKMWRSKKVAFTEYATSDVRIDVFGRTAVVTGRLHRTRDFDGRAAIEDWLFTKTYAQIGDRWTVVAYHASAQPSQ